jgi:ribosome-binding protein aMBF1 (putative translation factor)
MYRDRRIGTRDSQPDDLDKIRDIATAVKAQRELKGWTQGKLAEEANVNEATVQVLESAKMLPLPSTMALIAKALQMTLEGFT